MKVKIYDDVFKKAKKIYASDEEALKIIDAEIESQEEITVKFTPLLNFEFNNINRTCANEGYMYGCKGGLVEDIDADIVANHCIEPAYTYDELLRMKSDFVKKKLSLLIYENSKPTELDEFIKKKIKNWTKKEKEE